MVDKQADHIDSAGLGGAGAGEGPRGDREDGELREVVFPGELLRRVAALAFLPKDAWGEHAEWLAVTRDVEKCMCDSGADEAEARTVAAEWLWRAVTEVFMKLEHDQSVTRELQRLRARREAANILAAEDADGPTEPQVWALEELLADPELTAEPKPLIRFLAWAGRATLLAKREKLGGTTIATAAVAALTTGRDFLEAPTDGVGGLVLWATEEHVGDVARRLRDFGADPAGVVVMRWGADPIAEIRRETESRKPVLIVIDTLSALAETASPDSGSASDWARVMRPLVRIARDTGVSILILHHSRKSDGTFRDSTEIAAAVDVVVEMTGNATGNIRHLAWRGRYGRGSVTVRLDGRSYSVIQERDEDDIARSVLAYVKAHPGCTRTAVETGVPGRASDVRAAIDTLLDAGRLLNSGSPTRHSYRVPPETPGRDRDGLFDGASRPSDLTDVDGSRPGPSSASARPPLRVDADANGRAPEEGEL